MSESELSFPYIRAWSWYCGSFGYYTEQRIKRAHREQAPRDAVYPKSEGGWATFADIQEPQARKYIQHWVDTH